MQKLLNAIAQYTSAASVPTPNMAPLPQTDREVQRIATASAERGVKIMLEILAIGAGGTLEGAGATNLTNGK